MTKKINTQNDTQKIEAASAYAQIIEALRAADKLEAERKADKRSKEYRAELSKLNVAQFAAFEQFADLDFVSYLSLVKRSADAKASARNKKALKRVRSLIQALSMNQASLLEDVTKAVAACFADNAKRELSLADINAAVSVQCAQTDVNVKLRRELRSQKSPNTASSQADNALLAFRTLGLIRVTAETADKKAKRYTLTETKAAAALVAAVSKAETLQLKRAS